MNANKRKSGIKGMRLLGGAAGFTFVCISALNLLGQASLNPEQLKMLQDPEGWQYASIAEEKDGRQVVHKCFDEHGQPHRDVCQGTLTLTSDWRFLQEFSIGDRNIKRRGTYELKDDQLTFIGESGQADGPYRVMIRLRVKYLGLSRQQNGITVGGEFELAREFRLRSRQ